MLEPRANDNSQGQEEGEDDLFLGANNFMKPLKQNTDPAPRSLPENFILSPILSMEENQSKIKAMIERNDDDENEIQIAQLPDDMAGKAAEDFEQIQIQDQVGQEGQEC